MKILVTGASGHIGAALLIRLASDYEVTGTDITASPFRNGGITWGQADLADPDSAAGICRRKAPDAVIHCAGIAHQKFGNVDAASYMRVNSQATENLARAASSFNRDLHFIFLSSVSIYGEKQNERPIGEDEACSPSSDYAFSKLDAEKRLKRLYEEGALNRLTILRLAPVYDREWAFNLERRVFAPKKIAYLQFGDGRQRMAALARQNLVGFVEHILKRPDCSRGIEIMNVCDSEPYSFKEIIAAFKRAKIYADRPTVTIPLPVMWASTRIAGFVNRGRRDWLYSCYDKLALNLVFDNSRMLRSGFKPVHNLGTVFAQNK